MKSQATVLAAAEGSSHWIVGDRITFKLKGAATGNRFTFAETSVPPGGGPPPHIHEREDEMFYLLEGQVAFVFGEHTFTGKAGDAFYLPKGIVHTFRNVGDRPARFLVGATPSGFENFVAAAGTTCTDVNAAAPIVDDIAVGRLMAAAAQHGLTLHLDHQPRGPGVARAADTQLWVLGVHVRIKLTADDTAGNFTLAEITCDPGTGVPAHAHLAQDEMFFVKSGTFEFELDGATTLAPAGTFVHVPVDVVHGFRNVGSTPGTLVDFHSPGGFERFFEECGVACRANVPPPPPPEPTDLPRIVRLMEKHGMTVPAPVEV